MVSSGRAGFYEQDIEHSQNREYANNEQRKERSAFCPSGSMYSFMGNVAGSACRGICESSISRIIILKLLILVRLVLVIWLLRESITPRIAVLKR